MSTSTRERSSAAHAHKNDSMLRTILGFKWLPFAIGAAISLIIIIAVCIALFGRAQYDKAVKSYLHISHMHESGYVTDLAPASVWGHIASKTDVNKEELTSYLADNAVLYQESLCDHLGHDINLSYDIKKSTRIKRDELDTYRKQLAKTYKIPETSIGKVYRLVVDVTLQGSENTETTEGLELTAVQVDGVYYVEQSFAYALDMAKDAQDLMQKQNAA